MRKITPFLCLAMMTLGEQAFANEVLNYEACALVEDHTVHWDATNETVLVRILVENAKGETPETLMTIFRKDGSIIFEQSGTNYAEGGPLYEEAIDCSYHAHAASDITLEMLEGDSIEFYGTEVKSSTDIVNMIREADSCSSQNIQRRELEGIKAKCDDLVYQVKRFLGVSNLSKNELLERLSKDQPIFAVSDEFLSIGLYVYNPDTQKTIYIAPLNLC